MFRARPQSLEVLLLRQTPGRRDFLQALPWGARFLPRVRQSYLRQRRLPKVSMCLFFRSPASGSVKLVWSKPAGREQVCFVREPKAWRRTGKRCYRCVRLRVVGLFCGLYRGGRAFCLECDSRTFASAGRQRFRYVTALSHIYTHYLELSTGFSKRGRSCYNYFKTFNFPCFS